MATAQLTQPQHPSAAIARVRVRTLDNLDEIDALEIAWQQLDASANSPISRFAWTRAALSAFADDGAPHVLAALRGESLIGVAPMVSRRVRGIKRLCLAGVKELYEPADLVWSEERGARAVAGALARAGAPIVLERIAANSPTLKKLKRKFLGRAVIITRPQAKCPYIALDDGWLEPEQRLNSGRRSDLRRARRKAEQLGAVTTEISSPDLVDLPRLLDMAFEVEANSWKGETGTALAHDSHRALFYRQYAEAACMAGILRICFLRIGDRVAAMQLAVEQAEGFWLLKVGYDAQFANCSPGLLLMRDTIRYAVEAGLQSYEFLGRAEAWTQVWTSTERDYVSLHIYPIGVRGLSALAVDAANAGFRRWKRRAEKNQ